MRTLFGFWAVRLRVDGEKQILALKQIILRSGRDLAAKDRKMEVQQGIHRVTRGVTNFYLIEDSGKVVVIDAGTPRDWGAFTRALSELHLGFDDVDAVLLTHAHADHTGFAEQARSAANTEVWIHEADELAVTTGQATKPDGAMSAYLFKLQLYKTMISLGRRGASKMIPVHEVSTFGHGETLELPGRPRVIHAPGHTAGSCALLLEDKGVLFAGDVLSTWNPLTGDMGPQIMPAAMNANTDEALSSLDELDDIAADTVLPGHGEPWKEGVASAVKLARETGRT
jgi:glyoxylase-like metal-dependent hydrolase (beta-lactamase superfamily II)